MNGAKTGSSARTWEYRPELDGLRCVAVYLVLLFHTQMSWMSGGFIGVDVFFVLSGFLVTSVIGAEVDRTGTFRLGAFYARRVRRLLPAAVLVVVATSLFWLLVASLPQRIQLVRDAQAALVYLSNWHFIVEASDYFATETSQSPFLHFWSLSIEEQFYVFYPLMILGLVRISTRVDRVALAAVGGLALLSLGLQVLWAQVDATHAYYGTEARLYQLLAGAALAFGARALAARDVTQQRPGTAGSVARPAALLGVLGLVAIGVLGSGMLEISASTRGILATAASVVLIWALCVAPTSVAGRLLASRTPVYLGTISYGTYLWHWPVILALGMVLEVRPLVLAVLAGVLATGLAALSAQVYETPIRRARGRLASSWPVVAAGLVASVGLAALVVGPVLLDDRSPVLATVGNKAEQRVPEGLSSTQLDRKVPEGLDYQAIGEDRGLPDTWCGPTTVEDCEIVEGGSPHIVVVGDSHARMVVPAFESLAVTKGFRVSASIVSSCPWQSGLWNTNAARLNQKQCRAAREDFYTRTLPRMDADIVVLATLARSHRRWQGAMVDDEGRARDLHRLQTESTHETLEQVQAAGAHAVILKSVMGTDGWDTSGWDPLDCLARAETLGDCAVMTPTERPVVDSFYDTEAVTSPSVSTVDLSALICPSAPVCSPMLDGRVVWRNNNHLTASFVRHMRGDIWEQMRAGGAFDDLG